jgi:hypothetical protein
MSNGGMSYRRYTPYDGYKDCYLLSPKRTGGGDTSNVGKFGSPFKPRNQHRPNDINTTKHVYGNVGRPLNVN